MVLHNSDWEKNEDKKFNKGKEVPQIVIKLKREVDWEYPLADAVKRIINLFKRRK